MVWIKETLGIYSQTDGVVYQRKGDKRQYHSQPQQHQADIPYIIVHGIYQVFLIEHFLDIGILFLISFSILAMLSELA